MFENGYFNNPFVCGFPTATQPYGYPMQSQNPYQQQQTNPQQQQTFTNKIFVSGIEEVRNRQLPPNSEYIFLDNEKSIIYQKTVDAKGQFEVKSFDIVPHVESEENQKCDFVSRDEFNALKDEFEKMRKGGDAE